MTSAVPTCARLVTALEDLVAAEAASCAAGDFAGMIVLQDRAEPLVAALVAAAPTLTDRSLRARISAVLQQRADTSARLTDRLSAVRTELTHTQTAQRRVARVAPVYGQARTAAAVSGQLIAVG